MRPERDKNKLLLGVYRKRLNKDAFELKQHQDIAKNLADAVKDWEKKIERLEKLEQR